MSTNVLIDFESLYGNLTADVTALVGKLDRTDINDFEESEKVTKQIHTNFDEADDVLEQMELEIRELRNEAEKKKYLTRLESYQTELKRLKKDFKRRFDKRQRKSLMGGRRDDETTTSSGETINPEERLLENTETLDRSSRKLELGKKVLLETEATGAAVLNDLAQQRETIQRSRNRLRDMDDDLGSSSRVLSGMIMRIQQSRLLMGCILIAVVTVIILGIYLSFTS